MPDDEVYRLNICQYSPLHLQVGPECVTKDTRLLTKHLVFFYFPGNKTISKKNYAHSDIAHTHTAQTSLREHTEVEP